ncbi:hypothetical protein H0H81_011745 [Sphagnurus paluster]|uniref:C2H2-type domain-containing protein n=1 Tax=Sphagnurus paluster TaxID=117069 RepID=A0A9P7GSA2_9AGAR|nr:hypothetical protein H0H81_011745 [Sphagnurus paluster]
MKAAEPEVIDLTTMSDSSEDEEDDDDEEEEEDQLENEIEEVDEQDGEVQVPVDAASRALLHAAIAAVREERLRQIVLNLAENFPIVEGTLIRELVTLKRRTQEMVPRWETCSNCEEEFDIGAERNPDECSFHPGELEVNEEEFADWDEACHGPMDTSANRRDYPENFTWSCCEEINTVEGCVRGMHQATSRKRRRM